MQERGFVNMIENKKEKMKKSTTNRDKRNSNFSKDKGKKPKVQNRQMAAQGNKKQQDKKEEQMSKKRSNHFHLKENNAQNINRKKNINSVKDNKKKDSVKKNAICAISKKCGACQMIGTPYEEQLKIKQKKMKKLLGSFGPVEHIIGMEQPYYYRNKVHAVYHRKRSGEVVAGVYEAGTHRVVPVTKCYIENEKADEIVQSSLGLMKSFKVKIYNEDAGYGLMRHILIRVAQSTGEIMVVFVTANPMFPSKNNFIKALLKLHPEITTIVQNINDKQTNMILGERENVLYGKGYIEDILCGKKFRISPKSFYQVNSVQTEILYKKAIQLADLKNKETIIDAYCGIGTISIIASKAAKEVIGVELNPDALKDAKINAKRNGIDNVSFYNEDAGDFMVSLAEAGKKIDVVFMDPPRSGSDEKFLSSVLRLLPKKIVYISCGPDTLARDLEYLEKSGKYKVKKICPVDLFPFTEHTECVVWIQKQHM